MEQEQTTNSNAQQGQYVLDYTGADVNRILKKADGLEDTAPISEDEIQIIMA